MQKNIMIFIDHKTYNEKFKENQEKLKERAKELLSDTPDEEEPQFIGNPIF